MTMTKTTIPALALGLVLGACGQESEEDLIADDLEVAYGGLTEEPEAPYFDEEPLLTALAAEDGERRAEDTMDADPTVTDMRDRPDVVAYAVTIGWGQFPGNREIERPRDWTGRLSVNRGAILVRSVLRFEDRTDRLLPREDRQVVAFTSVTLPHHDGLRLAILDPEPASTDPLVLTYTGADGTVVEVAVARLIEEPLNRVVDDLENRVVAIASRRGLDICAHGFLAGQWQLVTETSGRLRGRVVTAEGDPIGHIRGIFGVRESGEQVFFGKYIDLEGNPRGIFGGTYGEGHFAGRWTLRGEEHGRLGGLYREAAGDRDAGRFIGRWAQTSCDVPTTDAP